MTKKKIKFCKKCKADTERYKNGNCVICAKARSKEYKKNNREKTRLWQKKYRERNKEKLAEYNKKYHNEAKKKWYSFLRSEDKITCARCGYSKCIAAIDYHHINPKNKKFNISDIRYRRFTDENKGEYT